MFSWCMLNLCMRSCSGVRCRLMRHFVEFRTGLYNGCVGGSVANWRAALCLILSAKIWNGSRFAMSSSMSVATDFIAPVIMIAARRWIDASLLSTARLLGDEALLLPAFCWGFKNMSAAYSIRGMAMERYSCRVNLARVHCDVFASLLNWISQSCPFASATAQWPFQLSLLSTITPRNLAVSFDGICWLPRISVFLGIGILHQEKLTLSWVALGSLELL